MKVTKRNKPLCTLRMEYIRRKILGMNRKQFAEYIGISQAAISRYEMGARFPSSDMIYKICERTGISADYIVGLHKHGTWIKS